ncbi:hypothetical protein NM208_g10956 [Fusarium decemcellulare]|uniref:Uncharacterized protein n=1 Tax=Fusarium decemcellulare TaxID=57161 RepID=A0ACC1RW07_9HYPO|nr:hypothetical protein NM208_g10956 [Fusarium decemcellulare]
MTSPSDVHHETAEDSTPSSEISSLSTVATSTRTKRTLVTSPETRRESGNRRKASKVSRACDHCKLKKLKCTGTIPCNGCSKRKIECQYDSQYRRGRPPTPPAVPQPGDVSMSSGEQENRNKLFPPGQDYEALTSRATSQGPPGLETAEIEGQFFDPTSNLTFIHRAWRRLAQQTQGAEPGVLTGSENLQPLMSAGDKPFATRNERGLMFVNPATTFELFNFYFDNCVVTYRVLNQQYCHSWLEVVLGNVQNGQPLDTGLGHAKAAIVVNILAIASLRQHKISEPPSSDSTDPFLLQQSEQYFLSAADLTARETGLPRLESAQARVLQVLYLLQTSRMNQAWIATIIENVSREVYSLKKMRSQERLAAAQNFTQQLHDWRTALPPHLGTVRPSSLIPIFGRQSAALKLAYCHAIMHTTRPFLLDHSDGSSPALQACVTECISAAKLALELVDRMFSERTVLFHALWWMPYVTFCALAVVYVWEIQQKANDTIGSDNATLFSLAERCQSHLSQAISADSASRRYSIIIEELRLEARHSPHSMRPQQMVQGQQESIITGDQASSTMLDDLESMFEDHGETGTSFQSMLNPLSQWQPTDWLDLDSSAFSFFSQLEDSMIY